MGFEEPPPVSTMATEVPPGLDAVIAHCLEKDRTRRWESADQLASALRALASSFARGQRLEMATEPEARLDWTSTLEALPDTDVEHLIEGRYAVTGSLAERRATRIYRGKRLSDELSIAVKLYGRAHRHAASEDARKRFLSLAGRAARIEHPNLVRVFDYGVIGNGNRPFLVMELLNGISLGDYLEKHGPLTARRAIQLFEEILAALAVGHGEDLVHGDIKPSSLVLVDEGTRNERLCALDYLIATPPRDLLAENRITGSDQLSSGRYLPPEYVNEQEVGPPLDVYQAGLVLAECLTGEPLIGGDSVMQCIAKCSVGDVELDDRILDSPLAPIIERALAFDVNARFADAGEFADALSDLTPKETNLIEACLSRPRKRRSPRGKSAKARRSAMRGDESAISPGRDVTTPHALDTADNLNRFRVSTTDVEGIGSLAGTFIEHEDDTDSEHVSEQEDDLFSIEDLTSAEEAPPESDAAASKGSIEESGTRPMSMMEISQLVHPIGPDRQRSPTDEVALPPRKGSVLWAAVAAGLVLVVGLVWYGTSEPKPADTEPVKHAIGTRQPASDGGTTQGKDMTAAAASVDAASPPPPARPPSRAAKVLTGSKPARKPPRPKPKRPAKKPSFQIR